MSGGALGSAAAAGIRRPTIGSVTASTFLLAGSQALGILLEPTGVKRGTFNDFAVNPGEASDTVSYIAGTVETVPHLITYFDFHSKKVKNDTQIAQMLINAGLSGLAGYLAGGGTFGLLGPDPPTAFIGLAEGTILGAVTAGLGQLRTASYRYYCGFLYGICHGPIDSITAVKVDERIVSFGAPADTAFLVDDPQAWGGDHIDGGVYAICDIISGKFYPQQLPNPYLVSQVSNAASFSGKAMFLVGGFTRAPESGYFAATPQGSPALRPLKLRVRRLPDNLGVTAYHDISGDANIAECCFEWLTSPVFGVKKLPLSKIDVASFQLGAQTHHTRGLGISLEMNSDVDVESALDKFTDLGGSIIYGSFNSGTIRYKVIERNYSIPSLPVFRRGPDGSLPNAYNVIRVSGFTPGTWANTSNDQAFTYTDRDNNFLKTTRYVQDTANRMLTGRVRSLSQEVDGVSNGATAAFVGTRELRAGSYPRPPLTLVVNRDGYTREPGDVIKYIDNVDNYVKILRITEVQKLATDSTAEITLNCVEDQYGVGAAAYSPFVPTGFHLTLHLSLALEDSLVGLSGDLTSVQGLTDGFAKLMTVFIPATLSDSINNLADAVSIAARSSLSFSDSFTLSDTATIVKFPELLTKSLSDDANNLADTVSTNSASYTTPEVEFDGLNLTGSDGDDILTWPDSSGRSRNATAMGTGLILKTNIQNGHQVCRCSGGVVGFDFSGNSTDPTFTVIAVIRCTDFSQFRSILCDRSNGSNAPLFGVDATKIRLIELDVGDVGVSNTAMGTTNFYTVAVTFDDTTNDYAFYLNGSADGSGTQAASFSRRFGGVAIRGGNLNRFVGDIAYVAYWNTVLGAAELSARFSTLCATWQHYACSPVPLTLMLADDAGVLTDNASAALASTINTPSDLADIWEWWEPSREGLSNNDPISTLTGQVAPGTGHNFTQSTSGERPTYKTGILSGQGVARFNGSTSWLHNVNPSGLTGAHVFIVVKSSSNNVPGGEGGLWGGAIGNPRYAYATGTIGESIFRSPAIIDVTSGFDLSAWRVYEVLSIVTEFRMRIDGTSIFNDGGSFATYSDQRLGNNGFFFTEWFNGDVAGMYIFSAKLSSGDRASMILYLNNRFGLSAL